MAIDRREADGIALQLSSLVHCWFMWEMFRLKQAQCTYIVFTLYRQPLQPAPVVSAVVLRNSWTCWISPMSWGGFSDIVSLLPFSYECLCCGEMKQNLLPPGYCLTINLLKVHSTKVVNAFWKINFQVSKNFCAPLAIYICGRTYSPKYFSFILFIGRHVFLLLGSWNTTISIFPAFVVSNIICLEMSS